MNERIKIRRNLLRRARKIIEHGINNYVCTAVYTAAEQSGDELHVGSIRGHIAKLLGGAPTLCCWYRKNAKVVDEDYSGRLHRLAWIDHMLKTDPFFGGKTPK